MLKSKINYNKDPYGMVLFKDWKQIFPKSEDELIMELPIQKEPLEFLVSILK